MSAIFFGNFLAVLSITTINVAFPVVMEQFDATLSTTQWLMAGYLLATGIVAPIVGYMGTSSVIRGCLSWHCWALRSRRYYAL